MQKISENAPVAQEFRYRSFHVSNADSVPKVRILLALERDDLSAEQLQQEGVRSGQIEDAATGVGIVAKREVRHGPLDEVERLTLVEVANLRCLRVDKVAGLAVKLLGAEEASQQHPEARPVLQTTQYADHVPLGEGRRGDGLAELPDAIEGHQRCPLAEDLLDLVKPLLEVRGGVACQAIRSQGRQAQSLLALGGSRHRFGDVREEPGVVAG